MAQPSDRDHVAAVERWRRARTERLTAPAGWLTLVDRIVLEEGDNETPIGRIQVSDGQVWLRASSGKRELRTEEVGPVDRVLAAGLSYELARIAGQFSLRVKDPEAPARRQFRGLDYYPIDPAWRLRARFDLGPGGRTGVAQFRIGDRPLQLTTEQPVASRLSFLFGDDTNTLDTYPGGRFLYAEAPAGGELVLDFNFAFNPPCAFTPHAICPALPPENRLPLSVSAGEKNYSP